MLRFFSVAVLLGLGASMVYAQSGATAIAQRKEALKAMGAAAKEPGGMIKGEAKFDLPKVQASLKVFQDSAAKLPNLFPDDSKTGDTNALPAAFEKRADVQARFKKLGGDAAAAASAIKDEATFTAEWPKVVSNCGACHKEYRKP